MFAQGTANFYSVEKERALGASLAGQMRANTTPLGNAVVSDYVQKTSALIAAQLPQSRIPYTIAVIKDDKGGPLHEPVVLPGAYIFVPAPLILTAQSDAEFIGMLAQAMAQAASRAATLEATTGAVPVIFYAPAGGDLYPLSGLRARIADEAAADLRSVDAVAAAGFDPIGLAAYIGRVQPAADGRPAPLPEREARLAAIDARIGQLPARTYRNPNVLATIQNEVRRSLP
jgi:predicted Zn-dependent protease